MQPPLPINPRYKLLIMYNIKPNMNALYYRYVVNEFVPALNKMDIYVIGVWHTAYGNYPIRQVEYVADSLETFYRAFDSPAWQTLENRLKDYTLDYQRKVVRYRNGFQF